MFSVCLPKDFSKQRRYLKLFKKVFFNHVNFEVCNMERSYKSVSDEDVQFPGSAVTGRDGTEAPGVNANGVDGH